MNIGVSLRVLSKVGVREEIPAFSQTMHHIQVCDHTAPRAFHLELFFSVFN
jgi:hypothetical protein